jgi:hypothetical protein
MKPLKTMVVVHGLHENDELNVFYASISENSSMKLKGKMGVAMMFCSK